MSSTLADLEIATFAIDEVVEGAQTGRSGRQLVVSLPQLAVGAGEPALAEATVEVVRPGDPVRISNVLDAVLPDVRADDPALTFPGVLGHGETAPGDGGRVHRLNGLAVLAVCDWAATGAEGADELPDSLVDMAGPAADRSPWGGITNLVVRFVPSPGAPPGEADAAVRRTCLRLARDLAATTRGAEPDEVRRIGDLPSADAELPAIAMILQVASEGPLLDTFLNGVPLRDLWPIPLDPRSLPAGNLTNGAYDWPAVRNTTAVYQESTLLRSLLAEHGRRLRFAGVILAPGYLDGAEQKRRSAEASAALAEELGADGVVCTTFSSGNSHTDTMLTVQACEARGVVTVALVCETNGGLTDHVPAADCLISTGNEDELTESWTPARVIGSDAGARVGERVPTWAYLGACGQTGDARWTARPA